MDRDEPLDPARAEIDAEIDGELDVEAIEAEEAYAARRLSAIEAGRRKGGIAGAAMAGAAKVAERIDEGVIVFVVCDGGWKYLSTGAYTADLDEAEANAEAIIYF